MARLVRYGQATRLDVSPQEEPMPARTFTRCLLTIFTILAYTSVALGTSAQETSPEATPSVDLERASAYPVAIHPGTCDDPVAQPVGPAIDAGVVGFDPDAAFVGINPQLPVLVASADYEAPLAYFTEAPHVIAIHESSEEFGTIIACGQIAGYIHDGTLVVGIRSVSNVAVNGVAILEENTTVVDKALDLIDHSAKFGDESTHIAVYIVPGVSDISEED